SDVGLCFSPERMVEGQAVNDFMTLPKIVGASDPETVEICCEIIGSLGGKVIKVSSPETAEMIKMVDNYSRFVFLGLTNEFALISEKLGIDVLELIKAAKEDYPRNSGLLLPGPGVGGSCLNKDPYILKAHMRKLDLDLRMVNCAMDINMNMPYHVCELVEKYAKSRKNVTIWGIAFKGDTDDTRFTPAYQIYDYLKEKGFIITASDPYVNERRIEIIKDEFLALKNSNILLVLSDHSNYKNINFQMLKDNMSENPVIIDTRGIIERSDAIKNGFEYHGLGRL
ncbi:MAG: nucleotide sugar dehydrogenase, partial [Thermoplasmataceae archaeon]